MKAVHLTELRSAVDSYRVAAGLGAAAWTDASLSGPPVKAVHIQELRARLDEARAALGYAPAGYTDPTLTAGTTSIRAIHLTELRALVQQPGTDGALRYYHTDAIGSVRMTTDQSGNVVARFDDQPFGEPVAASGEPRRFTGAERDGDTGFNYLGARYLSSASGRFTRPDDPGFGNPFDPQSMNLYSYAYNNPLRYVDPTGHDGDCVGGYDRSTGLCTKVDAAGFTETPFGDWLGFIEAAAEQPQQQVIDPVSSLNLGTLAQCASDQLGLTDLFAAGAIVSGQPIPGTKRFVMEGTSRGTSLVGLAADRLFKGAKFQWRVPTIVGGPMTGRAFAIARTRSVARVAGRAVPMVGWAMLAYDAASIAMCSAR